MVFVFGPRGTGNEGAAGGLEHSEIETQSPPRRSFCVAPGRTRFLTNQLHRMRDFKALGERKNSQDQKEISVHVDSRRYTHHTVA